MNTIHQGGRWTRSWLLSGAMSLLLAGGVSLLGLGLLHVVASDCQAGPFDEMSVELAKRLREAERYQISVADKFYREQNWKVAAAEYEKFLQLHDKGEAAAYAQLKWSLCQIQLRKSNTAIKEGFQSVIDYWPDSDEARASSYLIGRTYKEMGELKPAKKAYDLCISKYPKQYVAALSKMDLAELAKGDKDNTRRLALLKELTFDTDRKVPGVQAPCVKASIELAAECFVTGKFAEGQKALETSYPLDKPDQLLWAMNNNHSELAVDVKGIIGYLENDPKTKAVGDKLADDTIQFLQSLTPAALTDDPAKNLARACGFYKADTEWYARRGDKTIAVYEQMLQTFGVDDDILGRMAQRQKELTKRDLARATYARYKDPIAGLGQIAYSYREERDFNKAAEIYRELIGRDAKNSITWQENLGHVLREGGQYKEAIAAYRAWDKFPESLWYIAECHRALGEFKEAIGLLQQVMAEAGWAPQALLQIAYIYEQSGEKEKAIKAFQQVCKRYPKSGQASQSHAHLENQYKINATLGGATDE